MPLPAGDGVGGAAAGHDGGAGARLPPAYAWGYRDMSPQYRDAGCADGGALDERPGDPRFP